MKLDELKLMNIGDNVVYTNTNYVYYNDFKLNYQYKIIKIYIDFECICIKNILGETVMVSSKIFISSKQYEILHRNDKIKKIYDNQ